MAKIAAKKDVFFFEKFIIFIVLPGKVPPRGGMTTDETNEIKATTAYGVQEIKKLTRSSKEEKKREMSF